MQLWCSLIYASFRHHPYVQNIVQNYIIARLDIDFQIISCLHSFQVTVTYLYIP